VGESGRDLEGRVALVTGAGTGIGKAIAERLHAEGALVAIDYRDSHDDAHALAGRLSKKGPRVLAVQADVSRQADVESMVATVVKELGGLQVLVNNAGIEQNEAFLEIDEASWDRILAVNLKGPFLCTQAAARQMKDSGGGVIVNVSSIHEDVPLPGFTAYAVSKGGLRMLTRNLAEELARYGVRINNVAPGAIATPINKALLSDAAKMAELARIVPLGHIGTPEDVAEVVCFLASDRSRYVTGSTYYVDGGMVRHAEQI
jgi:glucose 1-dehydrogenase